MDVNEFVSNYPYLYHMAARGSWERIQAIGLMSTSSLLDAFEIHGHGRDSIELQHRPEMVAITHGTHGIAHIRDQKPMSDAGLKRALTDGLTPRDWYRILNAKVFFWVNEVRLHRLLCARAYKNEVHDVLVVDSTELVPAFQDSLYLSPINSGATKPFPHPRGITTFLRLADYPWSAWVAKRGIREAVVEAAFEGGISDVSRYVVKVVRMRGAEQLDTLYERG